MNKHRFIKSVIEVSHVAFTSYDLHTHRLICSTELAQKMLGYTSKEFNLLKDHFYNQIIHPDDLLKVIESIKGLTELQENEIIETIARYRKANGEYMWVYSRRMVSERDDTGQPTKITSVSQDVTEEIHLQEELRINTELLEKISYKNSHEIRGAVATILGLVSLIDEKGLMGDLNREYFKYLKIAVQKLDHVIAEINDLADKGIGEIE